MKSEKHIQPRSRLLHVFTAASLLVSGACLRGDSVSSAARLQEDDVPQIDVGGYYDEYYNYNHDIISENGIVTRPGGERIAQLADTYAQRIEALHARVELLDIIEYPDGGGVLLSDRSVRRSISSARKFRVSRTVESNEGLDTQSLHAMYAHNHSGELALQSVSFYLGSDTTIILRLSGAVYQDLGVEIWANGEIVSTDDVYRKYVAGEISYDAAVTEVDSMLQYTHAFLLPVLNSFDSEVGEPDFN